MKIYEVDEQIRNLIDEDTGEITDFDAFEKLQLERETKIEGLCVWYKEIKAEAKAIKEEKDALAERQKVLDNKTNSLTEYLKYILGGQVFKTARVSVTYRKSTSTKAMPEFTDWAVKNGAEDLLTYTEPVPSLTRIKEAINAGRELKFVELVEKQSIQIR